VLPAGAVTLIVLVEEEPFQPVGKSHSNDTLELGSVNGIATVSVIFLTPHGTATMALLEKVPFTPPVPLMVIDGIAAMCLTVTICSFSLTTSVEPDLDHVTTTLILLIEVFGEFPHSIN